MFECRRHVFPELFYVTSQSGGILRTNYFFNKVLHSTRPNICTLVDTPLSVKGKKSGYFVDPGVGVVITVLFANVRRDGSVKLITTLHINPPPFLQISISRTLHVTIVLCSALGVRSESQNRRNECKLNSQHITPSFLFRDTITKSTTLTFKLTVTTLSKSI